MSPSRAAKGRHGTAIFVREDLAAEPVDDETFGGGDPTQEGRTSWARIAGTLLVGSIYTPNSGMKLERKDTVRRDFDRWLRESIAPLAAKEQLILLGDLNVAATHDDLARPKERHNKVPGACDSEREDFQLLLTDAALTDVYRHHNPEAADAPGYTFWSFRGQARAKNLGWRLDYALASSTALAAIPGPPRVVADCKVSDHVPLLVDYKLDA